MQTLQCQKVYVLGAGLSGQSAARLARREGAEVCLADSSDSHRLHELARHLEDEGITVIPSWRVPETAVSCDLCIVSPGVPADSPMVRYFTGLGCQIVSELEFGASFCQCPKLAVTGTNGKTTTVEMLSHCLQQAGHRVLAGGNIGLPLAQIALDGLQCDRLVVEVSSYQLETTRCFETQAAALLNITPDHLNRHGSMEAYRDIKLNLLRQTAVCVLNDTLLSDQAVREAVSGKKVLTFSADSDSADFTVKNQALCRRSGSEYTPLIALDALPYTGKHNWENALAVLAMSEAAGLSPAELAPHLASFTIGPHRMEIVLEDSGVRYVNDSKATNLDAMVKSLQQFRHDGVRDIALIAGGLAKGCDLAEALPYLKDCVKGAFLIGTCREELQDKWGHDIPCECCDSLEAAVNGAAACVASGGTVLLSPGCASMDMFTDYIARGTQFADLVHRLRKTSLNKQGSR